MWILSFMAIIRNWWHIKPNIPICYLYTDYIVIKSLLTYQFLQFCRKYIVLSELTHIFYRYLTKVKFSDKKVLMRGCSSKKKMFHVECENNLSGKRSFKAFLITLKIKSNWSRVQFIIYIHILNLIICLFQEWAVLLLQPWPV